VLTGRGLLGSRDRHAAGFTLIEMMVTLAIFSILVALTVPTMRTWIANTRLRAAADTLQNGIRLAQTEALRRSRQVVFGLTNTAVAAGPSNTFTAVANGKYWAVQVIPAYTGDAAPIIQTGVLIPAGSAVQITGPAAICFNSVGRLVANTSTGVGANCTPPTTNVYNNALPPINVYQIQTNGADRSLSVEVALGGQLHLCDPTQSQSGSNSSYAC